MYGDQLWFKDMADALREKYGKDYKVSSKAPPKFLLSIASWFDNTIKLTMDRWGITYKIDNEPSKQVLGIQYTDCRQSILEMAESLIELGYIPDKRSQK